MSTFFDNIFSMQFSKRIQYSTLLSGNVGNMEEVHRYRQSFGALLTDLSNAFDCLGHELLTQKLNAYGFRLPALQPINDYFSN